MLSIWLSMISPIHGSKFGLLGSFSMAFFRAFEAEDFWL